jgi:hypothetical protein
MRRIGQSRSVDPSVFRQFRPVVRGGPMLKAPNKRIAVVVVIVVLVGAAALGRGLLDASSASTSASRPASSNGVVHAPGTPADGGVARASSATNGPQVKASGLPTIAGPATAGPVGAGAVPAGSSGAPGTSTNATLPLVPVLAITPQIVRTATVDLRIGRNKVSSSLADIAALAATDGGYVESSSMAGGTARTSPLSGNIVIHVLDSDFNQALDTLSGYGKLTSQQIQGKDVTNQVSSNAATIEILQEEVSLLQGKLAQATDINTFLEIQNQLFPVEQQLQQLQNQQAVLENSAAFATITADLSAPGGLAVTVPPARPGANAVTTAWHYLRHNSLAVLDGLAVGGGWALPGLALVALVGLAGTRIVHRRRRAVNAVNPA